MMEATHKESKVTIHMVASLDGFIAGADGRVDWLETQDHYEGGETLTDEAVQAFLDSIDCYVMGARTYETAVRFEAQGMGWAYGEKPVIVLTHRPELERGNNKPSVEFHAGDLEQLVQSNLKSRFRSIWFVGGGTLAAECLRLGLADEIRYSIAPVAIGSGISFFNGLAQDVPLHLLEVKAYTSGIVGLRYAVLQRPPATSRIVPVT